MKQRNWAVVPGVLVAACLQVGVAQAQSDVRIYGRIDLGVRHGPVDLSKSEDRASYMDDSSRARLGFTGKEDLGNGNSAFFQLEHRFNGTTGALVEVKWQLSDILAKRNESLGRQCRPRKASSASPAPAKPQKQPAKTKQSA